MDYVIMVRDLAEQIMGIGLGIWMLCAFLSIFGKGDTDRYNGAGTLDQ